MHVGVRRLWLRLHRWVALSLGLLLALQGFVGSALVVVKPIDAALNPQLFKTSSSAGRDMLEAARRALVAEFGDGVSFTLRPPREPGDTLWALVHAAQWDGTVYFDPASARELGRRGEHEGVFNLLFEVHSSLLLGDAGKALLAGLALAYGFLLVSGLLLWWPARWRDAVHVESRRGATRLLYDLHRVGGAVLGLAVAVVVASGAYMAWRPLSGWVTAVSGDGAVRPPAVRPAAVPAPAPMPTLDAMVRGAQALHAGAPVGYVQVAGPARPVRVRIKLADDPHPNGLTSVWLHPASGEVLGSVRFDRLDAGARAYSVVYPLHTGALGGALHTAVQPLLGLALAGFGVSGAWLWWRRRKPQGRRSNAASGSARTPG